MLQPIIDALKTAGLMGWEILWPLVLGFLISGVIQAVVSHREMARLLPDASAKSIAKATALGAASSSCSYAAVAIARSIFRKGGNFVAAMAFQFASTNLVLELGIILAVLLGLRFTAATWAGGIALVVILTLLLRLFVRPKLVEEAKEQAKRGIAGRMEGHAAMDMSVTEGPLWKRLTSAKGMTVISHYYWMDWASVWFDIALGLLIAGALAAWVPHHIWALVFASADPATAKIIGPLIGPLIAVVSFVCSVGNVPLAAVLWNGGASFGGVTAFIFADLIVLPILDIYRRYYGLKVAALIAILSYASMVGAGYFVELLFGALHLVPAVHNAQIVEPAISWNYTTWLNLIAIAASAVLLWRFMRTGGRAMLKMMNAAPETRRQHESPGHSQR